MNNFGVQYLKKSSGVSLEKNNTLQKINIEISEIKKVLCQFQDGYTKRDKKNVEDFVEKLFIMGDGTCVLGTGTGELFLGIEQVKTLIKNDWEYWGDVNIDLENIHIDNKDEVAWFATTGTVKYTFEDTQERYDNYLNFIKNKTKESKLTPKQKITFINWVLALTYHQRLEKKENICGLYV
ncbi:nuclear transport factor 2 family protein [Clostridium sp. OS1-26]|uniref:nuclear transport factor 2 family protein n=1 Tax=Clostridium sp. OS1-26 TaxID=3070681 RepID=UPI0027E02621|nr:nuclear transport factor 2 family protein [Clostridium sp. OS1-26]WML33529.1 nuclear transport factor 2 family protein [Clostridium sp. OS1-26]